MSARIFVFPLLEDQVDVDHQGQELGNDDFAFHCQ